MDLDQLVRRFVARELGTDAYEVVDAHINTMPRTQWLVHLSNALEERLQQGSNPDFRTSLSTRPGAAVVVI